MEMCDINLILTNFDSVLLKVCLSTLRESSRHNYCIAEIPLSPFQHSFSSITQNMNPCNTQKKLAIPHNYILELSGIEKGNFSMIFPKRSYLVSVKFSMLPPRIFNFLWKGKSTLAHVCAQGANVFLLFFLYFLTPFNLRVEIKSLRKGMDIITAQSQSLTTP